jgi:signal transduction histidine kinase
MRASHAEQTPQTPAHLQLEREQILTGLLRVGVALGSLAMVVGSLPPLLDTPPIMLAINGGLLLVFWVAALRRQLAYSLRAGLLVAGLYLASCIELAYYGLSQDASILFLFCTLLTILFFNRRVGGAILALCVTTLAGVGSLISLNRFTPLAHPLAELSLSTTITTCLIFVMIAGSIQAGVVLLLAHLDLLWQREHRARLLLVAERDLLEQRVAARTHELALARDQALDALRAEAAQKDTAMREISARVMTEQVLQQQAQELQRQNVELELYARTVAHDLKSPLSGVLGYSQMLLAYPELMTPQKVEESARAIQRASQKMTTIIDALLLFARVRTIEAIPRAALATEVLVAEVEARLHDEISAAGAVITHPECWPAALGYTPWVEEVWANYLSNAIKYGGEPPVITLGSDPAAPGFVRFWVRDNGPGLSGEQQAQLFTPFTRLHTDRAEGQGLGLSIVQRIIERLGGAVGVESAPGQGATFFFMLPAADEEGGA